MQLQFDPIIFAIATLALAMAAIQLYLHNPRRRFQVLNSSILAKFVLTIITAGRGT